MTGLDFFSRKMEPGGLCKRGSSQPDIRQHRLQILSAAAFIQFYVWTFTVPYEGKVLYAMAAEKGADAGALMRISVALVILGLFCGIFVRSVQAAGRVMLISNVLCVLGSVLLAFAPPRLWMIILPVISFFLGAWTAAWGWFYCTCTPPGRRVYTAALCLGATALLIIGINLAAASGMSFLGLLLANLSLIGAFFCTERLTRVPPDVATVREHPPGKDPLKLLCPFILFISVDVGLMYTVITPAFSGVVRFSAWFWTVPYAAAVGVFLLLPPAIDRCHALYAALSMLGLSFLTFMVAGRSAAAYLVVNTFMLGAYGINDLFLWTAMGEMLDSNGNPARILGIGLAANVAGVHLGEEISRLFIAFGKSQALPIVGIAIVCVSFTIMPILLKRLGIRLRDMHMGRGHWGSPCSMECLSRTEPVCAASPGVQQGSMRASEYPMAADPVAPGLTQRESQVIALLLRGYTRQLIAEELAISEATVKSHIRNIYGKLGVVSKTELIEKLRQTEASIINSARL